MATNPDVLVVGAGILGLASAYHILRVDSRLNLLVLDRLRGPGRGTTARSAAAYRDMFATPVNRHLAQGTLAFFENLQESGVRLGLLRIGYLWLLNATQMARGAPALKAMSEAGVVFETLEPQELTRRLPDLRMGDIFRGILGNRCGILNPNHLSGFYAREITHLGGQFHFNAEVTGFVRDSQGLICGVKLGDREIMVRKVLIATGPWLTATLALAGQIVPVVPVKRQLFALNAKTGLLNRLLYTPGFNSHGLLPFTILPGGAYLRPAPAANAFIIGFANEDQPPGLEDRPAAEPEFFKERIQPQLERYLPIFHGAMPGQSWAGLYEDHPPDRIAFVDQISGALVVGGASGSGIMKADSLGRVAAGLYFGRSQVELGDGKPFEVAGLSLQDRNLPPEEFVI
ncbi:MAG: FAD-binding oxidoreductase [Deltaproteobacteria bacterium]|nr:FAD-binding oxidoreductase [Deltaproteobacteria bacterium]